MGTYTDFGGPPFYEYGSFEASIVVAQSGATLASASFQIASLLQDSLTTNGSTFQLGQPIQFTFTRTNRSNFPVLFGYGAGDIQVTQGGQVVWPLNPTLWNADYWTPNPTVLQPGQTWTDTRTWGGWTDAPFSCSAPVGDGDIGDRIVRRLDPWSQHDTARRLPDPAYPAQLQPD